MFVPLPAAHRIVRGVPTAGLTWVGWARGPMTGVEPTAPMEAANVIATLVYAGQS